MRMGEWVRCLLGLFQTISEDDDDDARSSLQEPSEVCPLIGLASLPLDVPSLPEATLTGF